MRPAEVRTALLEPGARIDLDQTIEERRDGELVRTRRARVELAIGRRAPDGTYAAQALVSSIREDELPASRVVFELRLAPDLTVLGNPSIDCDGLDDDLAGARTLRHVLGAIARPRSTTPVGGAFEGELWDERSDEPLRAETRLRVREPGRVRITAEAELALDGERLAGGLVTGRAQVRVIAELDDSLLVGTTRTRIEVDGTIRDPDDGDTAALPAQVRVDERIVAVRAPDALPMLGSCEQESARGAFDARLVVRMIQTRQAAIRACYERELRTNPTLAGSFRVWLTILESGMMGAVHTSENTMGSEAVAECTVGVIRGFRFTPGPEGGSVTFQFPFVFEPEG